MARFAVSRSSTSGSSLNRSDQRRATQRRTLAPQRLRRHRRQLHGLHRLHARDAVPAAVHRPARRHRRRADRDLDRPQPRRHAGADGAARAGLGPARRSLRPQDHGRAIAGQLRRADGGDGVRHARRGTCSRCARCRGCSPATARCRSRWRPSRRRATGCRRRSASVQTAQRLGPAVGPVIGGVLARLRRLAPRVSRHRGVLRRRARARAS